MDLHATLVECASAEGFPVAGSVDLDLAHEAFQSHIQKYDAWLNAGYAGGMEYLKRGRDRRADPRLVFPEAQSIFCVAMPSPSQLAGSSDPNLGPRYARYLQGEDYHLEIPRKLERVMEKVNQLWMQTHASPLTWKLCVDTSAVLEKAWAAIAGLGWIGKNTLLIHPQWGSYIFLGEVLLNQKTGRAPSPLPNYCGHCTRCLDSCPTQAFIDSGTLDSTRCISYWTLENRAALKLQKSEKTKISTWVAGCDICQEKCPFNRKSAKNSERNLLQPSPRRTDTAIHATDLNHWRALLLEDATSYKKRVQNSALNRVKPFQFRRNLAISLTNFLEATSHSEFISHIAVLEPLIQKCLDQEPHPVAKEEWENCLKCIERRKSFC